MKLSVSKKSTRLYDDIWHKEEKKVDTGTKIKSIKQRLTSKKAREIEEA